jgi:DMSO/TMAO reductase YedYZ molybdopterin-dependent catalytic subunit
MQNT